MPKSKFGLACFIKFIAHRKNYGKFYGHIVAKNFVSYDLSFNQNPKNAEKSGILSLLQPNFGLNLEIM